MSDALQAIISCFPGSSHATIDFGLQPRNRLGLAAGNVGSGQVRLRAREEGRVDMQETIIRTLRFLDPGDCQTAKGCTRNGPRPTFSQRYPTLIT